MGDRFEELYRYIEEYASRKELPNTMKALPFVKKFLIGRSRKKFMLNTDQYQQLTYFEHSLNICRMVIDLNLQITQDEEDILLATTLCHDMLRSNPNPGRVYNLMNFYHIDTRVYEKVKLITKMDSFSEEDKKLFYENIQKDKLGLLIILTDRGNLMEEIHVLSIDEANKYVREIRNYCLPMCIYAKQHYLDVMGAVNILMEKIHCLIEVSEIMSDRFHKSEMALMNEILNLEEENARMRGMIAQLQADQL